MLVGAGEEGADDEEFVLDGAEFWGQVGRGDGGGADGGIQFVDGTDAFEAWVGFGDPAAADKTGGTVVAGLGVDLHGGIVIGRWSFVISLSIESAGECPGTRF